MKIRIPLVLGERYEAINGCIRVPWDFDVKKFAGLLEENLDELRYFKKSQKHVVMGPKSRHALRVFRLFTFTNNSWRYQSRSKRTH